MSRLSVEVASDRLATSRRARIVDLTATRERRDRLILELRGRGLGVPETALLVGCRPATVERLAPAWREGRHQPLQWVSMGEL